jgi:hypothetical protein
LYIHALPTWDPAGPLNESDHALVQGAPGVVEMVCCEFDWADEDDKACGDGDEEEHAARLAATTIPSPATMVRDRRETLARKSLPQLTASRSAGK